MAHLFYQRPVRRKLLGQGCGGFRLHGEKLLEPIDLLIFFAYQVSEVEDLVGLFFHQFREVLSLKVCPLERYIRLCIHRRVRRALWRCA